MTQNSWLAIRTLFGSLFTGYGVTVLLWGVSEGATNGWLKILLGLPAALTFGWFITPPIADPVLRKRINDRVVIGLCVVFTICLAIAIGVNGGQPVHRLDQQPLSAQLTFIMIITITFGVVGNASFLEHRQSGKTLDGRSKPVANTPSFWD